MFPVREVDLNGENFPKPLRDIPGFPRKLYYQGILLSEAEACITIVGTRRATPWGLEIAGVMGRDLAEAGITVVSGLAVGIDGAAHRGALKGGGRTIAILAGGLNKIYPREHESLAVEILKAGGALVSEYEPGADSLPNQFLERNRIVSGLSLGVVVIEAPLRSGAISTAHYALEQGREVFVVPGPAHHYNYFGAHKLIRDGARLVTSARDIIEDLGDRLDVLNPRLIN